MDDIDPTPAQPRTGYPAAASTSSTPPDASQPADTVTDLGERILAELGAANTNDTLTRWLCHHTARLLDVADRARAADTPDADARSADARAAILQLWQHRSAWPNGWPPRRATEIVRLLDDLPDLDDPSWHQQNMLNRLHTLHHHVLATLCDLATVDDDTSVEQSWLNEFGDRLTPDETTLLARAASASQRLDSLLRWWDLAAAHDGDAAPATDEETAARTDTANNTVDDEGTASALVDAAPAHPLVALANAYRDTILTLLRRATPGSHNARNDDKRDGRNDTGDNEKDSAETLTHDGGDVADT